MSRSVKRNPYKAFNWSVQDLGGRVPVIRKDRDCNVSHSKPCYMCEKGTQPKRLLRIKPRRRREKEDLRRLARDEL